MPKYNRSIEEISGVLFECWTNRNGSEQKMVEIGRVDDDDDDEDGEEGCDACGNPAYPMCMDSCPLFDD